MSHKPFPHVLLNQFLQVGTLPAIRIGKSGEIADCNPAFVKLARRDKPVDGQWLLVDMLADESKPLVEKIIHDIWNGKPSDKPYSVEFKQLEHESSDARVT
ncbi:MAG: hypothetical protein FJX23_08975, partial [Alphaproteobacteria bacterium]|nr:hypothetical protein [Alphaproteobacteria bacterium]